ncbi:hypothetical protein ACSBR2_037838 [Camellia fascicularis]
MASEAVASAPIFIAKLLRHSNRQLNHSTLTAPLASATRTFSSRPPPRNHNDPNPFLRTGELGACRVDKSEKECYMRVDVPGIAEEEIRVWSESGFIYFYGKDTKLPHYNYDGRAFGGSISFNPQSYDSDGLKAEVKNGVLWLSMPRLKEE